MGTKLTAQIITRNIWRKLGGDPTQAPSLLRPQHLIPPLWVEREARMKGERESRGQGTRECYGEMDLAPGGPLAE